MRCLMFGAGHGQFETGWAKAASNACEVVGLGALGNDFEPIPTLNGVGRKTADGIAVLGVNPGLAFSPSRIMWRLNDHIRASHAAAAVDWVVRESGDFDVVHSHFYAGAGSAARIAERLNVPLIHTEHSSALLPGNTFKSPSRAGRAQARYVYGRAARVLFVSDSLLEAALTLGLRGNFEVVPNPVEDDMFYAVPKLPSSTIQAVTVGNLIPSKRHNLLLEAFAVARKANSRLRLGIVGSGPLRSELESLAARLGLGGSVEFRGRLSRAAVAEVMSQSDLYVHTSASETFGLTIIEALACGLSVVTTDCGGVIPELNGYPVRVVEGSQPEVLARAMVSTTESLHNQRRDEIARKTREQFGLAVVGARIGDIYRQVTQTN